MAKSFSLGKVELVSSTDAVEKSASMEPEGPFQILVLGDFSGRATRGAAAAGVEPGWRPIRIDRDNFDQVMSRLGVELRLAAGGDETTPIVLKFQELDDFHPDRILERTEVFQALREKRRALSDPTTFRRAMREASEPPPHQRHAPAETAPASPADLLDQILAQTSRPTADSPRPQPRHRDEGPWEAFLEKITASHRVPGADPQQAEMVASVDAATSQLLRDILHHRDFQALEAAWRGLYFLTRRLDTDGPLSISLLDLTRAELADDLASAPNLESTKLYARTSEDRSTQRSWAVLIGNMEFAPEPADLAFLGRMAGIARAAGGTVPGGGQPPVPRMRFPGRNTGPFRLAAGVLLSLGLECPAKPSRRPLRGPGPPAFSAPAPLRERREAHRVVRFRGARGGIRPWRLPLGQSRVCPRRIAGALVQRGWLEAATRVEYADRGITSVHRPPGRRAGSHSLCRGAPDGSGR